MPGDLIPGMRLNHLSLEAKFRQTADEVITERTRVWDVENLFNHRAAAKFGLIFTLRSFKIEFCKKDSYWTAAVK